MFTFPLEFGSFPNLLENVLLVLPAMVSRYWMMC